MHTLFKDGAKVGSKNWIERRTIGSRRLRKGFSHLVTRFPNELRPIGAEYPNLLLRACLEEVSI